MKTIWIRYLITAALIATAFEITRAGAQSLTVDTTPTGLTVTVDGVNYTAPAIFNWESGSLHTLDIPSPQVAIDGHSRSNFGSWSDGGAQSHSITMPAYDTNYTATFSTQYILNVTISPAGAGTVSNYPAGPWYDAGQQVSLTARTNAGYRASYWSGVDSSFTNIAQVTMGGYRSVQAGFILFDFPYVIVTNRGTVAPGSLIGNIAGRTADGTKLYYIVLDNTGTNILYANKTNVILRFGTPQGLVTA